MEKSKEYAFVGKLGHFGKKILMNAKTHKEDIIIGWQGILSMKTKGKIVMFGRWKTALFLLCRAILI